MARLLLLNATNTFEKQSHPLQQKCYIWTKKEEPCNTEMMRAGATGTNSALALQFRSPEDASRTPSRPLDIRRRTLGFACSDTCAGVASVDLAEPSCHFGEDLAPGVPFLLLKKRCKRRESNSALAIRQNGTSRSPGLPETWQAFRPDFCCWPGTSTTSPGNLTPEKGN